jgi:uncharacterized protein YcnI
MKKVAGIFIPAFISLFFFSSIASAHVTVVPNQSATGAWETYTIKVPVEKDIAATKITVKVPEGVELESYQPVPDWNFSEEKDANGKVKTFTFAASGQGILPGQFQQFVVVAKNPDKAEQAAWDAYQYYKDGSIVEWTGNEGDDTPHAITNIVAGVTAGHSDHNQTASEKTSTEKVTSTSSSWTLILSIASLLLSLVALITSIRKK